MFLCVLCACASKPSSSQTDSATLRHKIELDEVKERHRVALVGEVVDFRVGMANHCSDAPSVNHKSKPLLNLNLAYYYNILQYGVY